MPRENLIQLRGGTAAEWTAANPVLEEKEKGVETDTLKEKIGNGVDDWNTLSYFNEGGGQSAPVPKTGTTIVFTEDAVYNQDTPISSGDITVNLTGSIDNTFVVFYTNNHISSITGSEFNYLGTNRQSASKLNKIIFYYNNNVLEVFVANISYIDTPVITTTSSDGRIDISFATSGATSYTAKINTIDDENTATDITGYNGTDTSTFADGLTNGTTYYFFVKASNGNEGLLDSLTGTTSSQASAPNTLIGGMGAIYPNEASLASFLGITSGDISTFGVDGSNNITCDISANYSLPSGAFNNSTNLTKYIDVDGRCTAFGDTNVFRGATVLTKASLNGLHTNIPYFWDNPLLEEVTMLNSTQSVYARNCDSIKYVNAPLSTSITNFAFAGTNSELSLYLPSALSIGGSAFSSMASKLILDAESVTTATGTSTFLSSPNVDNKILLDGCTAFGGGGFTCRFFEGIMVLNGLTSDIGGTPTLTNCFASATANTTVYANNYLATNNGGNMDGDLQKIIDSGGTVIFNTNPVTPPSISDLSASNITTTSVDLNFTTPTTQNTYNHLDVYIDLGDGGGYRLLDEATLTGDTVNGLISGNETKIKVKTIDEFYNRSVFSNEITFTTL